MTTCVFTCGQCRDTYHDVPSDPEGMREHTAGLARKHAEVGERWTAYYYGDHYSDDACVAGFAGVGKRMAFYGDVSEERLYAEVSDAAAGVVREELTGLLRELQAEGALRGIAANCDFDSWAGQLMDRPGFFEADGSGWGCEIPASRMRSGVPHLLDGYVGVAP